MRFSSLDCRFRLLARYRLSWTAVLVLAGPVAVAVSSRAAAWRGGLTGSYGGGLLGAGAGGGPGRR